MKQAGQVKFNSNLNLKRFIIDGNKPLTGNAIRLSMPERKNCVPIKESAALLKKWFNDPLSYQLPEQTNIILSVPVPHHTNPVGYDLDLKDFHSKKNFLGPAGLFKWVIFFNVISQISNQAMLYPSSLAPLFTSTKRPFRDYLQWQNINTTWLHTLLLDSFIYAICTYDTLHHYYGNLKQTELAKTLGISNLGFLYSALSAFGYSEMLGYSNINLPVKSVDKIIKEYKKISHSLFDVKKCQTVADKIGTHYSATIRHAIFSLIDQDTTIKSYMRTKSYKRSKNHINDFIGLLKDKGISYDEINIIFLRFIGKYSEDVIREIEKIKKELGIIK